MFSFLVAGEEELVIPPWPAAFAQWTLGRALEKLVFPIVLPNGDKPFWVHHEEAVENDLILPCELIQFEYVIIVITVVVIWLKLPCEENDERHLRPICFMPPMDDVRSATKKRTYKGGQAT